MRLLDPETYQDRPYVAGLNQGGHAVSGAALVPATLLVFDPIPALICALLLSLGLELWQLLKKGAVWWDMLLDLAFWWLGSLAWFFSIAAGLVSGIAVLLPGVLVTLMGLVMALFTLFKRSSKEPSNGN